MGRWVDMEYANPPCFPTFSSQINTSGSVRPAACRNPQRLGKKKGGDGLFSSVFVTVSGVDHTIEPHSFCLCGSTHF